tara:strand:- start:48701 stop:49411 length:711 start_codon:yes stop_codon:yes gene_type:complete
MIDARTRRKLKRERESKPDTDVVGIDQSLSNCAMVYMADKMVQDRTVFHTGSPDTKEYKNRVDKGFTLFGEVFEEHEMQVTYIVNCVVNKIAEWNPKRVCLEGLAFGATGKVERQLAGLYFGIITELHNQLGYDIRNGDILKFTPSQVKKIAREFLPEEEQYLTTYTSRNKRKLTPMDKKQMVEAAKLAGYGKVLEGYTRKGLVASRTMPTGEEDLADAIFVTLCYHQTLLPSNDM